MKCDDPYRGLLLYRTTPTSNGYSPSQLLMGRQLRSTLPVHTNELKPKLPNFDEVADKENNTRLQQKYNHDRAHRVVTLPQLNPGDNVYIRDQKITGVVKERDATPRSYIIDTPKGEIRRNRSHLCREPGVNPLDITTRDNETAPAQITTHNLPESPRSVAVASPGPSSQRPQREVRKPTRLIETC